MQDNIIALGGQYVDLTNPDHMGCAIRTINSHWMDVELHHSAPKTNGHVASSMMGVLSRWAHNATTAQDRERVARWVKLAGLD